MPCQKCGGFEIEEWGDIRCINCGRRSIEERMMQPEARSQKPEARSQKPEEPSHQPRPRWTPERRQKFLATMRERGHFKAGGQKSASAAIPARRATSKVVDGMVIDEGLSLDLAIERLEADLAVLQQARQIVASYASRTANDETTC